MKKLLLICCALLIAAEAHAVKLCGKDCWKPILAASPAAWKANTPQLSGSYTSTQGITATWTFTSTTAGAEGTISGRSRCAANNSTKPPVSSSNGYYCWCQVTSVTVGGTVSSCPTPDLGGPWANNLYGTADNCQDLCAKSCADDCVKFGSGPYWPRSALFAELVDAPEAAAVTCPINGECENPNYKTVGDSDSCDEGWYETTGPALTISGEYSDGMGTFTYGGCAAN